MSTLLLCKKLPIDIQFDNNNPKLFFDTFSIDNIKNMISSHISFHQFNTFDDLIKISYDLLLKPDGFNVEVYYYNKDYVIQKIEKSKETIITGAITSLYEEGIFVKRKIIENDSYTFADNVTYEFLDMTIDDISNIIKNHYIHKGLKITFNDSYEIEYVISHLIETEFVDKLFIKENNVIKDITFVNFLAIANNFNSDINKAIEYINNFSNTSYIQYLFIQYDLHYCIMNCYYDFVHHEKLINNTMKLLTDVDFDTECFIGFQDINKNNEYIPLDKNILNHTIQLIQKDQYNINYNGMFFNIMTQK